MARFEGKVGWVSAGATGIGKGCAAAIVEGGGEVVICARREDTLAAAVAELGPRASYVVCDVSDEASVDAAVAEAVARHGRLDLAVNAAGTGAAAPLLTMPTEQFDACMKTNLYGSFFCLRAQARAMVESGGGSIVNISSIAAAVSHPWMSPYCASKAGLDMLTRCAADELGQYGVRVNAVQPGGVDTPMAGFLFQGDSRREYVDNMPLGRIGEPADIAGMVAFLLSDEAGWMTGQVVAVDGGHTLRRGPDLSGLFQSLGLG